MKNNFVRFIIGLLFLAIASPLFAASQQTSGVTAQAVIDRVRWEYLNESTASFWDSDASILNILNRGVLNIAALTKCMETVEKVVLQTGITEYAISTNYISVEKAIYSGATVSARPNPYKGLKRVDIKDLAQKEDVGEPTYYYIWNDYLGIDTFPSSSITGYQVYVYMIERPTELDLSGVSLIPTPAIYDHALELFIAGQAFKKQRQYDRSQTFMTEYLGEIAFWKEYLDRVRNVKETP